MEQSFVPRELDEILEPSSKSAKNVSIKRRQPTYRPTRWAKVNRILDIVDNVTKGRAGVFQRLFSYLFIGGSAAVVNLVVFTILFQYVHLPIDRGAHNFLASTISFEISLLANFIPNDFFTFRHLDGHRRSWLARCGRFHLTAIGGYLLTFLFQYCFHFFLHFPPILAQAGAILIVLFYNFTVHHVFTYRRIQTKTEKQRAISAAMLASSTEPVVTDMVEVDTLKLLATSGASSKNG